MEEELKKQQEKEIIIKELLASAQSLVDKEAALREQHQIGEKCRILQDKVHAILHLVQGYAEENSVHVKKAQATLSSNTTESMTLREGERWVYVYLYNGKGKDFKSWEALFTQKSLDDHVYNRPIYAEEKQASDYIRSRPTKEEYGYLIAKIKESDVVAQVSGRQDSAGSPLMQLKERCLSIKNMFCFVYKGEKFFFETTSYKPVAS